MQQKFTLFLVDDEPLLLNSAARVLRLLARRLPTNVALDFHMFDGAAAALEKIELLHPDLIISDNSMPGMTGFEFLLKVRAKHPKIKTMMVSAGVAEQNVRSAADIGQIDKLMPKPWSATDMFANITDLLGIKPAAPSPPLS